MPRGRFQSPVQGALTGVLELVRRTPEIRPPSEKDRLDGQTAMVTGSTSGVGLAVAREFHRRGANIIIVGRRGLDEARAHVEESGGGGEIRALRADLADLRDIDALVDTLSSQGTSLDVLVDNAGVASPRSVETPQGLEEMFTINVLAKAALLEQLLGREILRIDAAAPSGDARVPRIIYTSSDSHQGAQAVEVDALGVDGSFNATGGIHRYSYYKLVLNTWATEVSRRLAYPSLRASVHCVCPGPVNTNIIRDARPGLRAALKGIFSLFFMAPERSTPPFVYFAAAEEARGTTNRYLHMRRPKRMDEKCYDAAAGAAVVQRLEELLAEIHDRAGVARGLRLTDLEREGGESE